VIRPDEALARILGALQPLPPRDVPLLDAVDCFSAQERRATLALPPFDNSAMDGYAVVSSSCRRGESLRLVGEQPAGADRQLHLRAGEAIRIFTGAPMPQGADAVVMQEDTEITRDGGQVVVRTNVAAGEFVRRRGGDVAEGQKILSIGQRIAPGTVALLASQGLAAVSVGGRPKVSILSTGDELAPPGVELRPGQIYDSNTPLLQALVRRCGGVVESVQHCVDDEAGTTAAVGRATASDLLIITGGVSVGARDYVKSAITAAGGEIDVWRVLVKPGKPFLFGRAGTCAIFGLPGNPVSAFVTFLLFVRPALLRLMGASDVAAALPRVSAVTGEELSNRGDRPHYVRGSLRDGTFTPVGRQESHAVFGLSRSHALLLVPAGATIARGETASVLLFD
jgi:molybdopterin molybdotransferase